MPFTSHLRSVVAAIVATLAVLWGAVSLVSANGIRTERSELPAAATVQATTASAVFVLGPSIDSDLNDAAPILLATVAAAAFIVGSSRFTVRSGRLMSPPSVAVRAMSQRAPPPM